MSYKLTYFNGRGRAETIRMIFAQAGVAYEDVRIEGAQWPELKPNTPFGQLPILETDEVTLGQSFAIARYLARKFGLAGKSEVEQARADMIVHCIEDTYTPIFKFKFESDEARKAELQKKYFEEQLPKFLSLLENLLKGNNGGDGFFIGDEMTWADLAFLSTCDYLSVVGADTQVDNHPKLSALRDRVSNSPKIAEWLAKRPKTSF